ncbi:hypothetical protein TELCIR_15834 [Teladorsagia circumcincta]|uniref:Uncharacterized protein n=1 Tax=Teladorsagia circumcincta TaxID=45464 RepID=A0A2G9TXA7_TELCI|nr:hypothetical protein TELCIR_15834 [Teladorsagia circumcincta]
MTKPLLFPRPSDESFCKYDTNGNRHMLLIVTLLVVAGLASAAEDQKLSWKVCGYGDEGRLPQIPGKAKLVFDIVLEKLIKKDEL